MILDRLEQAQRYAAINEDFSKAFAFLRQDNLVELEAGRHEISGEDVYAIVVKGPGSGRSKSKMEAHREYVDIQYIASGTDEMGWKNRQLCSDILSDYDAEDDGESFKDEPSTWMTIRTGELVIFFPEDVHAPGAGEGELCRIVVKVRMK